LLEIINVLSQSTGQQLGLQPGDCILSVNGQETGDVIDFHFFSSDEHLTLLIQKADGSTRKMNVRKDPDDNLGLEFSSIKIKRCRNKCIFCFVDQMPHGCRKTLYIRDDDFRASFLYGNFITLSALSESDWTRIFRQRLSPLYISVHATDPALRSRLLGNKNAPPIMDSLKRLAAGGIRMHTQIVVCPGVNDGQQLTNTINDLASLYPAVSSVAVVPVGITDFRKGLFPLRTFSRAEARKLIQAVEPMGKAFKAKFGARLVFPSDELFIKAGLAIPTAAFYEDFPQIENGVGMVASFFRGVSRAKLPSKIAPITATLITGISFSGLLKSLIERLHGISGLVLKPVVVKNGFFGPAVTVAGLLTGGDILRALKGKRVGDLVIIPSNMLKEDEAVFLDGMTLQNMEQHLKVPVIPVEGFRDLTELLKKRGRMK
jgi:putative radical SAM enzyme (TIGR03279 family)